MRRKYQWEEWFARDRTVLLSGVHYRCSQSTMCQMVRNEASRRRLRVRLRDTGTEIWIEVIRTNWTGRGGTTASTTYSV
jgi:hypothetical protein